MSGQPFMTKFTVGLMTIEPCPQPEENHLSVEEEARDISAEELAARDAIRAKKAKKAKKSGRSKSPSSKKKITPPPIKEMTPEEKAVQEKVKQRMLAKKKEKEEAKKAEEEAAKAAAEEEARQKAEARRLQEEEERKAEEIRLRKIQQEEEEEAARQAEEEAAQQPTLDLEPEEEEETPRPRKKPVRRASFFPTTPDNDGLVAAMRRYDNDVPFDWEKDEWTMDFGNLRHTSTRKGVYGWEKPDWAVNRGLKAAHTRASILRKHKPEWAHKSLRKTPFGEDLSEMDESSGMGGSMRRRHSLSNMSQEWQKPVWARGTNLLRQTEAGRALRTGENLALPITGIRDCISVSSGQDSVTSLGNSFASLSASQKNINWEKPAWANPSLKPTEKGIAARRGVNLAKPITNNYNNSMQW